MRSCDVIRELWEVRCEKWNYDELGVISCDELWKAVDLSEVELWWVVMSSGAVMSEVWEVELWWVVCGATRKAARKLCVLRLPHEASRRPAAPTRAAAPPGGSVYCACHAKGSQEALYMVRRGPAAPTRAAAPPTGSVYCACHAKGSQEALCTAPATGSQPRPSGAHARRSSSRRLCALRLPRERQPGSSLYCACGPAAPTRAAAPAGGSVYCTCHAKGNQEALSLCTAPATRSQPRPSGAHARRSSSRRLCVLRLPRERQPGSSAPGTPRPSGAHARRSSSNRLCVLRLPRERQPGSSLYCACHTKPAAAQRRPRAPQLVQEALCTAPATRKAAAAPAPPHAPQPVEEALCTAPATRKAAAAPAAATRAAARPGGSVYCACHAKGSRGPNGGHARRSSSRRLCVVRLPRKRQALCTAPDWVSEWVREWRLPELQWVSEDEWVSEWVDEWRWVSEWVSESVSEWVRACLRAWVSECVCAWVSEWVRERRLPEWVSDWVSESVSERASECVRAWVSECVSGACLSEWVSAWVSECVSGAWVSEWVKMSKWMNYIIYYIY